MFNMGQAPGAQAADLEGLARRFWDTWREALQRTMPGADWRQAASSSPLGASAGAMPWGDPSQWWAQAAQPPGADALQRFQTMAAPWLAQIQRVAAGFAGRDATPEAIVGAWREAMGANPLGQMFGSLQGQGIEGWDAWLQRLQPWLDAAGAQGGGRDAFSLPTFGLMREHQERWQQLGRAFAGYQASQQDYQGLLLQASTAAFVIFERKLGARDPATPIETPRALFDLWIDAAEEAYADIALSPAFRKAYAEMVAGQMRLRQAVQREVEQACRVLDLPTRTELDGAHRKIADLERALRRMRDRLDAVEGLVAAAPVAAKAAPRRPAVPVRVDTPPAEAAPAMAKTSAAKTAAARKVAAKRPAKKASKPAAAKTSKPAAKNASSRGANGDATPRRTTGTRSRGAKSASKSLARRATAPRRPGTQRTPAAGTPARASRKAARPPSRVGSLPNLGFISPLPLAPEPLKGKAGKRAKGKR